MVVAVPRRKQDPVWKQLIRDCKDRGLGYADLGRICEVTRGTAYAWIHSGSQPTLATVRRLADELGYDLVLTGKPRSK